METPVQIDFRGMQPTQHVLDAIAQRISDLESRFGRVTAGRVVLKSPSAHHRGGGLYEVNIHLALPDGREVNIGHAASADERHANIDFALNNAFKRARRRLEGQVRRMQGYVKKHEERPIGIVKMVDAEKGYGFLESADGREIYFHQNSVLDGNFRRLTPGTRVLFSEEIGEKGPQASAIDLLGKHAFR
jgi:cold shock CspA family protein